MSLRPMKLMLAMDLDRGIAKGNKLPWKIRKDMQFFQDETTAVKDPAKINAVVMGRKCWDSIPLKFRPLNDRINVVLSRTPWQIPDTSNVLYRCDIEAALKELSDNEKVETIWIIGGKDIYKYCVDKHYVHTAVVTHIQERFDSDVCMDEDFLNTFKEDVSRRSETFEENGIRFSFHYYILQ